MKSDDLAVQTGLGADKASCQVKGPLSKYCPGPGLQAQIQIKMDDGLQHERTTVSSVKRFMNHGINLHKKCFFW